MSFLNSNLNNMVGMKVISNQLSCYLLNGTPLYNNKQLSGYYPIDEEGVIPAKKIVLVQDRILKNLQSNRTPTVNFLHSNGNSSLTSFSGSSFVFQLTGNQKYTYSELKKKLIEVVKEEGAKFGIVIGKQTRKIDVATGNEEVVDDYIFPQFSHDMLQLRHVIGVEDRETILQDDSRTFIVPHAVLLNEISLTPALLKSQKFDNKVPMPK